MSRAAREGVRTNHAAHVVIFLLMIVVLALGAYEALAALVEPDASLVLPAMDSLIRTSPAAAE